MPPLSVPGLAQKQEIAKTKRNTPALMLEVFLDPGVDLEYYLACVRQYRVQTLSDAYPCIRAVCVFGVHLHLSFAAFCGFAYIPGLLSASVFSAQKILTVPNPYIHFILGWRFDYFSGFGKQVLISRINISSPGGYFLVTHLHILAQYFI
jgi:hypothetical protein